MGSDTRVWRGDRARTHSQLLRANARARASQLLLTLRTLVRAVVGAVVTVENPTASELAASLIAHARRDGWGAQFGCAFAKLGIEEQSDISRLSTEDVRALVRPAEPAASARNLGETATKVPVPI